MHYFMPENSFWNSTQNYFMLMGIGIFTFISGLLIDLTYQEKITNFSNTIDFLKKRLIRILPLNWISIILSVFLAFTFIPLLFPTFANNFSQESINSISFFVQFIGAQLFIQNSDSYNWFVSLILICYFIYPVVIKFSKNILQTFAISILPLIIFVFLRLFLNLIDNRLFIFYMIFMGGVLVNRIFKNNYNFPIKKIVLFLVVSVFFSFIYFWRGGYYFYSRPLLNNPFLNFVIYEMIVLGIATISGCIFLLLIVNRNRINTILEKSKSLIIAIAVSSYCVYLFHFQFFTIGQGLIEYFKIPAIINDVLFYFIIIPLTFIFSYYIQITEQKFWGRFISKNKV